MEDISKCTLEQNLEFYAIPQNLEIGFKVYVELTLLDKNRNILAKKIPNNVFVEVNLDKEEYGNSKNIIIYKFVVKELAKELNINLRDISYVTGWIDANNDKQVSIDYDEVSVLEVLDCSLTAEKLNKADKKTTLENCKKHIEGINLAFENFEINNCLRKAHFLAQALHESEHLNRTKEKDNKDGTYLKKLFYYPYIGRGLIQLTGSSNYKRYGLIVQEDFLSLQNMVKLENSPHAAQSAGWFWKNGVLLKTGAVNLNLKADKNDFLIITAMINGGFNGYKDRLETLKSIFKEFYLTESTEYKFEESEIYNIWRYSFAWSLWNDSESIISKKGYGIDNKMEAKKGYLRTLELTKNITFPILKENKQTGKITVSNFYGYDNPKEYINTRLKYL